MIRLKNILKEGNLERDAAMVNGVADILTKVDDKENRKDIANQMMNKFDLEDVEFNRDSFLKLSGINEAGYPETLSFEDFAAKRLEGATKISNEAKEKGGASLLTHHHFVVKLPYYKKASEGKFDLNEAQIELKKYLDELCSVSSDMEQLHFQELVGLIEVLGELIIKLK